MGDILKEAIADAKAVRETALQNAKMALEEAFTPQLKNMLSAKLKEDEIEESDPVMEDEFEDDEEVAVDDEEGGEEEIPAEEAYVAEQEDEEGEEEAEVEDEEEPEVEEEGLNSLDLDSVIKELEQEISEEEGEDEAGEEEIPAEEEPEVEEESVEVDESDEPVEESSDEPVEEEYEIDEVALEEDEEELDEVDKSSGIGNGTGRGNTDTSSGIGKGGQEKAKAMESIKAELKEYKEAVSFLKGKLHEVNILNAKLLFTNKLFKEYSLNNNQKLKVVETFDRAQTTREIKLVYTTLAEQFGDNGSIARRKPIKESASSAVSSTKPSKESKKVISEETQVADRFRKLAGLIK